MPLSFSLESQAENVGDLIRVRLAQTAHGLRLLDYFEQIDETKPDEVAKRIFKRIESVMVKLSLPAGAAVPVGIVDIHRVQLGDKYRILERALPALLSVRIGFEPKIIMLEREDLKILQDEKLLASGEDSKFWGSGVLIEGNLQPKNGGLEMSLSLRRPAGEGTKSVTVPVDPNEPSAAVDKAAKEIVQDIFNAPPTSQWQLAAEAEQFYQEGQLLVNHSRYEEALPLFETAHTFQPDNVIYTGKMFEIGWVTRDHEYVSSMSNVILNIYNDLELAELASIFVRQIRDAYEAKKITMNQIYNYWGEFLVSECFRVISVILRPFQQNK